MPPGSPRSGATTSSQCAYAMTPTTNGFTTCRMRLHAASAVSGHQVPSPLRWHARAYAYPGRPASCFALPWRAAHAGIPFARSCLSISPVRPGGSVPRRKARISAWRIWGSGSNGTATRLSRLASPVAVGAFHAGIALREAVAIVRLASNVAQQLVYRQTS
jgi:hypothetical protein